MNLIGITFVTLLAMLCGVLIHVLKQLIAARRTQAGLTLRCYVFDHWPESLLSLLCSFVLYLAIPEIATLFPDFAKSVGITAQQTILSSFAAGFIGNSLADFLGNRVKSIAGATP